ncbi:MAG: hypothetical protein ABI760_17680 [Ferruginibacter sp.]
MRQASDGHIAFDDTVNEVSGTWVTDHKPATEVSLFTYIMVDHIDSTAKLIISNGGKIVQPDGMDLPEITARFSDPAGNIIVIFRQ